MFIEKLDVEDFKDFAKMINCKFVSTSINSKDTIELEVYVGLYTPKIKFILSDFDCKTHYNLGESGIYVKNSWREFLSQKFINYREALGTQR